MSASQTLPPSVREQAHAELFAELVVQHANMALIFVGAVPHPETGELTQDLEAARLFIDRLEMLETKTRGNLGTQETALLKQSLATARMAFVQAVEQAKKTGTSPTSPTAPEVKSATADAAGPPAEAVTPSPGGDAESQPEPPPPESQPTDERKKFVKKY